MVGLGDHLAREVGGRWESHGPFAGLPCLYVTGVRVDLDYRETDTLIQLRLIQADRKGTGAGSRVMQALRNYCDHAGKDLEIQEVENPGFFRRFEWLIDWEDSFTYQRCR